MNKSAFDYENEILLFDGANYVVMSVQDPTHLQYKFNKKIELPTIGLIIEEGTIVEMVEDKLDERGNIKVRIVEGPGSDRGFSIPPKFIDKHEEVKNVDSKGNPLTIITLKRGDSFLHNCKMAWLSRHDYKIENF